MTTRQLEDLAKRLEAGESDIRKLVLEMFDVELETDEEVLDVITQVEDNSEIAYCTTCERWQPSGFVDQGTCMDCDAAEAAEERANEDGPDAEDEDEF